MPVKHFFNDPQIGDRGRSVGVDDATSGFATTLRGESSKAAIFDTMFSPNAPPLAGTIASRTTGGTITSTVATIISFNRIESQFGREPPTLPKTPPFYGSGEAHGEQLVAQTKGFYIAGTYMAGNVGTTANSYGEVWHSVNNTGTGPPRIWDNLIKPVTTGGTDFIRHTVFTPMFLDKGDEVRSVWVFSGANLSIESDLTNNIYPRFFLIRLANL